VVVDRVLEEPEPDCSRCRSPAERHEERIEEIRDRLPDLDVYRFPESDGEVYGVEALSAVAEWLPGAARAERSPRSASDRRPGQSDS